MTKLPPRHELVPRAIRCGKRFEPGIKPNGETTVFGNVGLAGIAGWLNRTFFERKPRSFELCSIGTLRQLLDQVY